MEETSPPMPILRLAYVTQFLIALIAVYMFWGEVGGQNHLELLPWYTKLALGTGAAFAVVQATAAAVGQERAWNPQTLKWTAILIVLLIGCGLASNYAHEYLESDESDEEPASAPVSLRYAPGVDTSVDAARTSACATRLKRV
jgi:hypothetical protein